MEITATNLSRIQDGCYYLSNATGEIKKAGLWQKFKCFTGLGDGRAKVQRLVDHIKASLLADAAVKSDAALTDALDALDTTKSISSDDLKRIATNFKVVHADAIAKSDAMRTAKAIVDGVVEGWARKDKSVVYDPTNLDYMKKLALYAARPVIDKAAEYGDDNAMLVKALERYMGLLNQAVGVAEHICQQGHLGYPRSSQSAIPGRSNGNKTYRLDMKRFVLDELHFRFILASVFKANGKIDMNNLTFKLMAFPEEKLQQRKNSLLIIPLAGPEKPDALEKFLAVAAEVLEP